MSELPFGARNDAVFEVWARMNRRLCRFIELVGPYRAPSIYWLESDASESYCFEHIVEARGREFDFGPPLDPDKPSYRHTDLEDAFFEGLCGSPYGSESDSREACCKCGKTLVYSLTDYGTDEELDHFDDADWSKCLEPEIGYELDRATCNTFHSKGRGQLVKACRIVRRALAAAEAKFGDAEK